MTTTNTPSSTAAGSTADTQKDVDTLKADLAQLRDDLKMMASDAVDQGKAKAWAAKDVAQDKYEDTLDSLDTFVKERPMTAVGIAFAAGIVTSIYLRHR